MATLLQMYEMFETGQKPQFLKAVKEYGVTDFLRDIQIEKHDGVLSQKEVSNMESFINSREMEK